MKDNKLNFLFGYASLYDAITTSFVQTKLFPKQDWTCQKNHCFLLEFMPSDIIL